MSHPGGRRALATLTSLPVRIAVSAVLLAALALIVDWRQLGERIESGEWGWLAGGVALLAVALALGALRWRLLLEAAEVRVGAGAAVRAYWIGAFANNFLPTGFGGDAVRALLVARPGPALSRAASSVIVDRLSALACLLAVAWIGIAVDPNAVPGALAAGLAAITLLAGAAAIAVRQLARWRWLGRLVPDRAIPTLREMRRPLFAYAADRGLVAKTVALGLLYQALTVGSVYAGARAIGLELAPALLGAAVAVVLVLTVLPISLAGFGVREGGYALALGGAGVSATDATLISLVTVVMLAIASLPGAVALVASRGETAAR